MDVEVTGFGKISGITGAAFRVSDVTDTDSLRALLESRYPALKEIKYVIAVDKKMTRENAALTNGSVVALLPPFSGG
ncbi:MAG: MoaD/ThiS family protein [Chitinophagaceae bacterium]|nr:MAG: MoaD/ThiS family protein [Chitinophagaceae bacterium]